MQQVTGVPPTMRPPIKKKDPTTFTKSSGELAKPTHLHSLGRAGKRAGFVDEVRVLHVLREPLEEAQGLVEYNRHCDLRQLLMHK